MSTFIIAYKDSNFLDTLFDLVIVSAFGVPGDHLPYEAGQEEHHAQDHCQQGQVEQGLIRDRAELETVGLMIQLGGDDPHRHHEADEEHQDAAGAEKVHRLPAETGQEPQAIMTKATAETDKNRVAFILNNY